MGKQQSAIAADNEALTPQEMLDLSVRAGDFLKQEAGRLGKQLSGREISCIAGILDFLYQHEK
ncbi:hypothetical protein ACVD2L_01695 [Escherichia coli]